MPIDSISGKIMLNKAADFAREASNLQRQSEMMQNAAAQQVKAQAHREATEIVDVYHPSEAAIQRERERRQQQDDELIAEIVEMEEEEETEQKPTKPLPKGPPIRKLDIRI